MPLICSTCHEVRTDGEEFCAACGGEFEPDAEAYTPEIEPSTSRELAEGPASDTSEVSPAFDPSFQEGSATGQAVAQWELVPKYRGSLMEDKAIALSGTRLLVGRYDDSTGPVDIDLSDLPGGEMVSRHHAILEHGPAGAAWSVRDAQSANGVFVRRAGEDQFSARLMQPTELGQDDEVGFGSVILLLRSR